MGTSLEAIPLANSYYSRTFHSSAFKELGVLKLPFIFLNSKPMISFNLCQKDVGRMSSLGWVLGETEEIVNVKVETNCFYSLIKS